MAEHRSDKQPLIDRPLPLQKMCPNLSPIWVETGRLTCFTPRFHSTGRRHACVESLDVGVKDQPIWPPSTCLPDSTLPGGKSAEVRFEAAGRRCRTGQVITEHIIRRCEYASGGRTCR